MRIVFFGSSEFSVPFLEAVREQTVGVITSPDKRKNRGKKLLPNPVRVASERFGIPALATDALDEKVEEWIKNLNPNLFVVVSYGKIIPESLLSIPKCAINLHPSKLPLYRGAAPIERQIMDGVSSSAVCIIKVSKRLDRGDIIVSEPFEIDFADTREDVEKKVIRKGTKLLKEAIKIIEKNGCIGKKQEGKGSYAKKITKDDEIIDWSESAVKIYNKVRALYPRPAAQTSFRGKRLKIFRCFPEKDVNVESFGRVISVFKEYFTVSCGKGALKIFEVQLEGKKRISAKDFINGMHLREGELLG